MQKKERRQFARIQLKTSIKMVFSHQTLREQFWVENISEGGLFLQLKNPKPIGTEVSFEFFLQDQTIPVIGKGIVRWIETDPQKSQGIGIQFTELNEHGRKEISHMLKKEKK